MKCKKCDRKATGGTDCGCVYEHCLDCGYAEIYIPCNTEECVND